MAAAIRRTMAKKFPIKPAHPERVCWGCDRYCPSDSMMCGNGSERTQHPAELFGDDWMDFGSANAAGDGDASDGFDPNLVEVKSC